MYKYKLTDNNNQPILNSKGEQKIIDIYESDLKFTNHNGIKCKNIISDQKIFPNNTLQTRIEKFIKDGENLDLSHMDLNTLPLLNDKIVKQVKHLYISENNLQTIDLSKFVNLLTIDLSTNYLTTIPKLPRSVIELDISHNHIKSINELYDYNKLERLMCNNNMITSLPPINNLQVLHCINNKLTFIPKMNNLVELYCKNNEITKIESLNLEILDCTNNKLTQLTNFNNLTILLCDYNQISELHNLNKLEVLVCNNNNIKKLDYFANLQELTIDYANNITISKLYVVTESIIYDDSVISIIFNK